MTPTIARNPKKAGGLRRRDAFKIDKTIYKRSRVPTTRRIKKLLGGGRVVSEASSSSSWICTSTSWTDIKMFRTTSEICTAEFASWTILDEDFGNDDFLGECMRLYWSWTWWCEEEEMKTESMESASSSLWTSSQLSSIWCNEETCLLCEMLSQEDELEESMELFAVWTADDGEEVTVEPEMHDSLLMAALLSTKESSHAACLLRGLSCPDLLMGTPALVITETRHFNYFNDRLALLPSPMWTVALEALREMDPPNSVASTVSLPSGWDAVSARLSTSSIFNLFSDRVATPIPSLFIDPTGVPSTASTVSVPPSFWDTPSTVSVTGSAPTSSIPSSTSSLFIDPSEVSSSSISTLFMDPSSAHSCLSMESSGCTSSLLMETLSSSSSLSICPDCKRAHPFQSTNDFDDDSSDDEYERSRHTYVVSSASSGYDTDTDSEPVVLKKMTTTASTQTDEPNQSCAARMLAECDEMLEKLVEMKKRLREML